MMMGKKDYDGVKSWLVEMVIGEGLNRFRC